jgi:hypothetical protein
MKKYFLQISIILLAITVTSGCKRGEEDPFLSLKSRDSRVTGTWELKSSSYLYTETESESGVLTVNTNSVNFVNGVRTYVSTNGTIFTSTYSFEMTIDKNGSYMIVEINDGYKSEQSGYWWWLNDSKKKTRIAFDDDNSSYLVEQLKNKELILTANYFYKDVDTNGDWEQEVIEIKMIYEKK